MCLISKKVMEETEKHRVFTGDQMVLLKASGALEQTDILLVT